MWWNSVDTRERGRNVANEVAQREATGRAVDSSELTEEIDILKEQIGVLEEALPKAPGMQRAALAKEIAAYRAELDSKQQLLRQRRESGATRVGDPVGDIEDPVA